MPISPQPTGVAAAGAGLAGGSCHRISHFPLLPADTPGNVITIVKHTARPQGLVDRGFLPIALEPELLGREGKRVDGVEEANPLIVVKADVPGQPVTLDGMRRPSAYLVP